MGHIINVWSREAKSETSDQFRLKIACRVDNPSKLVVAGVIISSPEVAKYCNQTHLFVLPVRWHISKTTRQKAAPNFVHVMMLGLYIG